MLPMKRSDTSPVSGTPALLAVVAVAFAAAALEWTLNHRLAFGAAFEWRSILKHAALVAGLQVGLVVLCLGVDLVFPLLGVGRQWTRRVAVAGWTLLLLGIASLYAAKHYARLYLHSSVSRTVVVQTLDGLPEMVRAFPLVLAIVGVGWLASAAVIVWLAWWIAGPILRLVCVLSTFAWPASAQAAVGVTALGLAGAYGWHDVVGRPGSWVNDTIARLAMEKARLDITLVGSGTPLVPKATPDIIIILSDSLRADHFPQYGYGRQTAPFLSELAARPNFSTIGYATSTCPRTPCGVMSVLLSNPLSRAIGRPNTALQLYLRDAGYKVDFIMSGSHTEDVVAAAAFGNRSDYAAFDDGRLSGRGNDDGLVVDGIDRLPDRGREPHLMFLFLMSTHLSGQKLPAFRTFQPEMSIIDPIRRFNPMKLESNPLTPAEQAALANSYDNGILQADHYIRRIFSRLEEKGYLRDAVVFISSDHGEALGEHGIFAHTVNLFPEDLRVPLFIYDTSGRRYPEKAFASLTDIAATAVARLGLPVPPSWDGVDIAGGAPREWSFSENYLHGDAPCRGVYRRTPERLYYLLRCLDLGERLYDLTADPLGSTNVLPAAEPALVAEMRDQLQRRYPDFRQGLIWVP